MTKNDIYLQWRDQLDEDERGRFDFTTNLLSYYSDMKFNSLLERYNVRRMFALTKFKDHEIFAKDELYKASEELTQVDLKIDWIEIKDQLKEISEKIKTQYKSGKYLHSKKGQIWEIMDETDKDQKFLFLTILWTSGLYDIYMEKDIKWKEIEWLFYDTKEIKDFDKVIEILARFKWVIFLYSIIETKEYESEKSRPRREITFNEIFCPLIRDSIPGEVIRLLGPGQADAWEQKPHGKKWVYSGPQNAIMIPFFQLKEMGYISLSTGDIRLKISAWLREFGIEYRERTFDQPSKTISHNEHFAFYLNKLTKK